MLVTFSSEASGDISFFGDVAHRLLKCMGLSGAVPGALKADEVAGALQQLQAALHDPATSTPSSGKDRDEDEPEIRLSQRAVPLIAMLQEAVKTNNHVMWR